MIFGFALGAIGIVLSLAGLFDQSYQSIDGLVLIALGVLILRTDD